MISKPKNEKENKRNGFIVFYTFFKREFYRFFKVPQSTIVPALVTVTFYLLIFGIAIGTRIKEVAGVPYLLFILPGLYAQMLITGSYSNPSGSLFVSRQWGSIHDVLMSPISNSALLFAFILSGMLRGIILGAGALVIGFVFLQFTITNWFVLIAYTLLVSFMFALFGIIIGLWAKRWDQLNIFLNFVITPLTFLGGVFYTIEMVPPVVKVITQINPIFYFINGIRYGVLGISDGSIWIGMIVLVVISILLYTFVYQLIKKGYNLRV